MSLHPALILRAFCVAFVLTTAPALAEGRAGDFDFYILSLSWLPTYCADDDDPDPAQCRVAARGFSAHGLWPQYERGYPEFCPSSQARWLADETVAMIRHVMPSAGLARYQWRKHGMCSGLDEGDYFALLVAAAESIAIPAGLPGGQRLSPARIEAAFADANPGLSSDGMSVQCRGGRFTEIRICMTKDLAFRACDEVDADTCRAGSIEIPAAE